jgi:hypothetical protein
MGVAAPGAIGTAVQFGRSAFTATNMRTPGPHNFRLEPGRYQVYELTGSAAPNGAPFDIFGDKGATSITPEEVKVTGAKGEHLVTSPPSDIETVTRGSNVYTSAVQFRVKQTDNYAVEVTPPAAPGGRVLVARSIRDTAISSAVWIGLLVVGLLLSIVGFILLIVGIIRRRLA